MTQKEKILRHLEQFGSITPLEAQAEYAIMRLGARIKELRIAGYDIDTNIVYTRNRFGERTRYARYVYAPEDKGPEHPDGG